VAKILIVEDDVLLSKMYSSIFSSGSYQVDTAVNGQEGLDKARANQPDLILLDIMMLKTLKNDPDLKAIPVVILTNLAGDNDVQAALKLGAVRYIIKSELKPKEVEEIVRGILAGYTRNEIPPSAA
jgi:CheY-like chemotaxis protein